MLECVLHFAPHATLEHMQVVGMHCVTHYAGPDASGLLAATPSEGRHSWHSANFTATAAAGPCRYIMPAGWSNWTTGPERPSGKRTARPRDLRERADASSPMHRTLKQRHRLGFFHESEESTLVSNLPLQVWDEIQTAYHHRLLLTCLVLLGVTPYAT
jgi:hypothetical protein